MSAGSVAGSRAAVRRRAAQVCRERRVQDVRPGWWVFSHGPRDLGSWSVVTGTSVAFGADGLVLVRLAVTELDGRRHEVDARFGASAWCCTAAEAKRAGLSSSPAGSGGSGAMSGER